MFSGISRCSSLIFLFTSVCAAVSRARRVIEGELVEGRNTGYDAVRYYAAVATAHSQSWYGRWDFLLVRGWYGFVVCGGALITPHIVQTACHCLSSTAPSARNSQSLVTPSVLHHWESVYNIYVGVNQEFGNSWSMASEDPLVSRRFVIDQRCALLPKDTLNLNTHDYGWILTDDFLAPSNSKFFDRVNFAPIYPESEIKSMWSYLNERQPVCLHLGFGSHLRGFKSLKKELRHGWARMLTYRKCVTLTNKGLEPLGGRPLMSWVCTVPFSKHNQSTSKGDSGGPFTCNNLYFAIVMGGDEFKEDKKDPEVNRILDYDSPIAFAVYQNAKEWRHAFMVYMKHFGKIPFADIIRALKAKLNPNPTFNPFARMYHHPHSFSAPRTSKSCKTVMLCLLAIVLPHY